MRRQPPRRLNIRGSQRTRQSISHAAVGTNSSVHKCANPKQQHPNPNPNTHRANSPETEAEEKSTFEKRQWNKSVQQQCLSITSDTQTQTCARATHTQQFYIPFHSNTTETEAGRLQQSVRALTTVQCGNIQSTTTDAILGVSHVSQAGREGGRQARLSQQTSSVSLSEGLVVRGRAKASSGRAAISKLALTQLPRGYLALILWRGF